MGERGLKKGLESGRGGRGGVREPHSREKAQ